MVYYQAGLFNSEALWRGIKLRLTVYSPLQGQGVGRACSKQAY